MEYLEENKILSDQQYCFRSGREVTLLILELATKISHHLNVKEYQNILLVLIDLKKALDTIKHERSSTTESEDWNWSVYRSLSENSL